MVLATSQQTEGATRVTKLAKRILLSFGTRPEAIKMAPVYWALRGRPHEFDPICCVTAQHREMLDQVLHSFDITPDIDLDLMRPGQDLTDLTSSVLIGMRTVLADLRPDLVLVQGDTTTAMASALAAFYVGSTVGHIEAGLRSFDAKAPYPEELNRRMISVLAHLHFAPTEASRANLIRENVVPDSIVVTGNTVVDALNMTIERIEADRTVRTELERQLDTALGFDWRTSRYVLVTAHRREHWGDGLNHTCTAIRDLATANRGLHFVYVLHLNPRARAPAQALLADQPNVHLVEPLSYEPFLYALKHCYFALTDSGGVQEEAPSLGKPVLLMRQTTERPEGVEEGAVRLVGTTRERIVAGVTELARDTDLHRRMSEVRNPYGDGFAGRRIADHLANP